MSTVTADATVQQWLAQLQEVTEIRDAQGNLLGLFTPRALAEPERMKRLKSLFDLEEAERIAATQRQGRSWAEIRRDLEAKK